MSQAKISFPGHSAEAAANRRAHVFPPDFDWGTATSAYQIEGAAAIDGRGPSIWDNFGHATQPVATGVPEVSACDHYHRFREDIALLRQLGVRHYRLSLSWPRVFPDGEGRVNEAGVAFYDRLIDALLAAGITPALTLFHWELPRALEERHGGWASRETAKRLGDLAAWAGGRYGDRVTRFITTNEFRCFTDFGYHQGLFAPGRTESTRIRNQVRHHGLLGHGYALQALRATAPKAHVGVAEDPKLYVPAVETPENVAAARAAFRQNNAGFLTALLEGRYPDHYLAEEGVNAPDVADGDFALISAPIDFLGLNAYTAHYVVAADNARGYEVLTKPPGYPGMYVKWIQIVPPITYWAPRFCSELWGVSRIYLTESGCGCDDRMDEQGRVIDLDRVFYLREHLIHLHRAVSEGYPVLGYYLWSFLDNYEWLDGLDMRFGLVHVDFATQKRTPKLSAEFYSGVIRHNCVI